MILRPVLPARKEIRLVSHTRLEPCLMLGDSMVPHGTTWYHTEERCPWSLGNAAEAGERCRGSCATPCERVLSVAEEGEAAAETVEFLIRQQLL